MTSVCMLISDDIGHICDFFLDDVIINSGLDPIYRNVYMNLSY